ncbi:unnamed protein product [Acanthoscelides obtectus]|uniref:Uncharacterized protein n=1 Tax=Acanthoscelides obtectus TaxID=200917 RepID=A0A9P0L319_ACAOB|nr:unnamed protein product [Acanthoscelides obtectus]CAK1623394.1 hypothetical protein AOBTE_LOCUS1980 [Acanthoscelides obtectus]
MNPQRVVVMWLLYQRIKRRRLKRKFWSISLKSSFSSQQSWLHASLVAFKYDQSFIP